MSQGRGPDASPQGEAALSERLRASAGAGVGRFVRWLDRYRQRSQVVDVGLRLYERDREAAGTLLGSALALRLFLFFVPLTLAVVGIAGVVGATTSVDGLPDDIGLSTSLSEEMNKAFDQGDRAPWVAIVVGFVFMATTGRSLTRALVISSALSWQLGGQQRTPVRVIGVVVGLIVGSTLIWAAWNRVISDAGPAVSSISLGGVAAVYMVLWSLLFLALPRATTDPGAALPGATVVAAVLTGLQAFTYLYADVAIEDKSRLYGAIGLTVAFLGWFFILGRTISFAFALNAVLFERIGSVSRLVFSLPILRILPRRSARFAHFFDLRRRDHRGPEQNDPTDQRVMKERDQQ